MAKRIKIRTNIGIDVWLLVVDVKKVEGFDDTNTCYVHTSTRSYELEKETAEEFIKRLEEAEK